MKSKLGTLRLAGSSAHNGNSQAFGTASRNITTMTPAITAKCPFSIASHRSLYFSSRKTDDASPGHALQLEWKIGKAGGFVGKYCFDWQRRSSLKVPRKSEVALPSIIWGKDGNKASCRSRACLCLWSKTVLLNGWDIFRTCRQLVPASFGNKY